ncbi:hypothetical protein [Peribacillus muralis]|uniref:hypothetical protein n=1 Tax=Peribacillus muralis TaxID=264697 RepID=UPI00366F30AF
MLPINQTGVLKFKTNYGSTNTGYDVIVNGEDIGSVYKTMLIDLVGVWKNSKSETLFTTRKEAAKALLGDDVKCYR